MCLWLLTENKIIIKETQKNIVLCILVHDFDFIEIFVILFVFYGIVVVVIQWAKFRVFFLNVYEMNESIMEVISLLYIMKNIGSVASFYVLFLFFWSDENWFYYRILLQKVNLLKIIINLVDPGDYIYRWVVKG